MSLLRDVARFDRDRFCNRLNVLLVLAALLFPLIGSAVAQTAYPDRTITLIVPLPSGSGIDIVARLYADKLSKLMNVPVVVANRPGGGGIIAAQSLINAPADGYTVMVINPGHSMLSQLVPNLNFNSISDFASITMIGEIPFVLIVPPSMGIKSVADFVSYAKSKPGTVSIATAGPGSATHVAAAYFADKAGIDVVYVPYRSSGDLFADLMSGRVHAFFPALAPAVPYIQESRVVALGVTGADGAKAPLEIPSIRSQGIEYEFTSWYTFIASAKTPPEILKTLNAAIVAASKDDDLIAKLLAQGITPRVLSLADVDARIVDEAKRLDPVLAKIRETMKN
jgi:tripartite-type tricarboxylate transporter receptor subunit TctC